MRNKGRMRGKKTSKEQTFRGETPGMAGHVFQAFGEMNDKRQFNKTVEALGRYINKKMDFSEDMKSLYVNLKNPILTEPKIITEAEAQSPIKLLLQQEDVKESRERSQALKNNLRDVYSVIWGQCSNTMQAKLKQVKGFETNNNMNDCEWLLKKVKNITFKFVGRKDIFFDYRGSDESRVFRQNR